MKTIKITGILLFMMGLFSCINDDAFTIPDIGLEENNALEKILDSLETSSNWTFITIAELKNQFTSGSNPFQITSNQVLKGYVVSSDQTGNFFKEFYLQDHPKNPTTGIKIALNLTNSYNRFNIGREVYIHLKDLYIGEMLLGDGVTAIGGKLEGNEVVMLTENQIQTHLFRSQNTEIITPLSLTFAAINKSHIGLFVAVNDVHFSPELNGKPYVDQIDDFDTQRIMQSCEGFDYTNFILETSTYALFKNEILPSGSGAISGIVTKTYHGDNFVLVINTTSDVQMSGGLCNLLAIEDYPIVLLEEDFEATSGVIDILSWTNYKEAGTKLWRSYVDEDSGSRAAKIGSYSSGNDQTIAWLISPAINLSSVNEAFLSFETSNSFSDGSDLEVLISSDWNGEEANIGMATWYALPANIVKDSDDYSSWVHSSYLSLLEYTGNIYIAFKYTGSGHENFDGTFELDTIKIIAN